MIPPNRREFLAAGGAALLAPFALRADEKATFSVDVSVVNILASVRDGNGAIVTDLTKEDFVLSQDGVEQEIRYFARQTDLPLTIGLLVDTSLSQRNVIEVERRASYAFLEQVLRPDRDEAFLISFDVDAELLQDLTGSREELERGLNNLELPESPLNRPRERRYTGGSFQQWPGGGWPGGGGTSWPGGGSPGGRRPRGGGNSPGGPGGPRPRGGNQGIGTVMYDAVFLAADEVLRNRAGRKTIILISDGVDMGSIVSRYDAIEAAQRADTIVHSIRYYDDQSYRGGRGGGGRGGPRDSGRIGAGGSSRRGTGSGGPSGGGRGGRGGGDREAGGLTALEQISSETGGRMFEVQDELPLEAIFEMIQEELRNQYSIGYTPAAGKGGEFRKIELVAKNKDLTVQTRSGYYSNDTD